MRHYDYVVEFEHGSEEVSAGSVQDAVILACAIRIHAGKERNVREVVNLQTGEAHTIHMGVEITAV